MTHLNSASSQIPRIAVVSVEPSSALQRRHRHTSATATVAASAGHAVATLTLVSTIPNPRAPHSRAPHFRRRAHHLRGGHQVTPAASAQASAKSAVETVTVVASFTAAVGRAAHIAIAAGRRNREALHCAFQLSHLFFHPRETRPGLRKFQKDYRGTDFFTVAQ